MVVKVSSKPSRPPQRRGRPSGIGLRRALLPLGEAGWGLLLALFIFTACEYDERIETCPVAVSLIYPDDSVEPYPGVRVELKDQRASVFVDSTDSRGVAHFSVPPGIYEASTATQLTDSTGDTWWRYNFNGVRSMIVVSPDSTNQIQMELKMSKRRIVR